MMGENPGIKNNPRKNSPRKNNPEGGYFLILFFVVVRFFVGGNFGTIGVISFKFNI